MRSMPTIKIYFHLVEASILRSLMWRPERSPHQNRYKAHAYGDFSKNFNVFIKWMECAITHSHVFTKYQHGTRFKNTKTVNLFGKIYNLNTGLKEIYRNSRLRLKLVYFLSPCYKKYFLAEIFVKTVLNLLGA